MEAVTGSKPVIKVAAICGSLREGSYNRGLLRAALDITKESVNGIELVYIDISPLPMLNTDLEVDGKFPPVVEEFRQKVLEVDSVLFASPEYNYSVTGPLKNAIDWASRDPNVWAGKAAAIISAAGSLGGARAQYHYRQIGVYLDLHFINKPEFFLNAYDYESPPKFDGNSNLIDPAAKQRLKKVLLALQEFTLLLKGCNLNNSTISKLPWQSAGEFQQEHALTPFTKENLGQRFHASTEYGLGRTSRSHDWYDIETSNNERRVINPFQDKRFKLKNKKYRRNAREKVYIMALIASWLFFLIAFMLNHYIKNVEDGCCKRNMFGRGLDLRVAYS